MARNFRVSLNGKSYDVIVEELGPSAAPAPVATTAPAVVPPPAAPAPAPTPAAAPASAAVPTAVAGEKISSPMPGKIWKLHVHEGDTVTEGQLVLILEAMKMENEIFAPVGGKITQILCKEGDSVNTGDALVVIA